MVHTKTEEHVHQKSHLSPRLPPNVILRNAWQVQLEDHHQRGTDAGQLAADEVTLEPQIVFRIQGIFRAEVGQEEENSRKQLMVKLVHAVMYHPNKDAFVADLRSKHPFTVQ